MSKKDRDHQLRDFQKRFYAGAEARGVSGDQVAAIWDMMMSFSGYSFCKPHSASYARVSFQAAYLRVHHPAEFIAAVISNQGGFYGTFAYVSEARRMGLRILLPDINRSEVRWTGEGNAIRTGLLSIKGLSAEIQARIVTERRQGRYYSMRDVLERVRPAEDEARALIHCGALDELNPGGNRAVLVWQLRCRLKSASAKSRPQTQSLFSSADKARICRPPSLPPDDERERLRREFAVLGFLCDRHPMELYNPILQKLRTVKAVDLPRHLGKQVRLAGWLITGKEVTTKHGDPMEFLTFEDETGIVETTFFPETYRRFCHMIDRRRPYLLTGKVEEDWGAITLTVDRVKRINEKN
jgi:DNA polymerase-3 subunit alpha/error-prone DNA polymerase